MFQNGSLAMTLGVPNVRSGVDPASMCRWAPPVRLRRPSNRAGHCPRDRTIAADAPPERWIVPTYQIAIPCDGKVKFLAHIPLHAPRAHDRDGIGALTCRTVNSPVPAVPNIDEPDRRALSPMAGCSSRETSCSIIAIDVPIVG